MYLVALIYLDKFCVKELISISSGLSQPIQPFFELSPAEMEPIV